MDKQPEDLFDSDRIHAYAEWLSSEIHKENSYHNHKETMAWVATALYLPAIVGLATVVRQLDGYVAIRVISIVAIAIAAVLVIRLFINMQFNRRWEASDVVKGLMKASLMLLNRQVPLTADNCRETERDATFWPRFACDEINKCSQQNKRRLKTALRLFFTCRWSELDDRWKTELSSYSLIILSTIVAIVIIAWPHN
jgi:hypothetical protein